MTDSNNKQVVLKTSAGDMTVEFFADKAPNHVANFIKLAESGFYNGTVFHRTMPGFMIQGGDPNTKEPESMGNRWGTGGPGHSVNAEFNDTPHIRGVLSMARSDDPNSAGSQFFICHGDADGLNGKYTAFGRLVSGDEVLDAIANAPTNPGGEGSSPVAPVKIDSAEVTSTETSTPEA